MQVNEVCSNDMTFTQLLVNFIKENKQIFVLYILCILILPFQDVALPHLIGKLYDCIKKPKCSNLWILLFFIIVIVVMLQVFIIFADYIDHKLFPAMQKFVRDSMILHQFDINKDRLGDVEFGVLMSHILKLPTIMYGFIDIIKVNVIPSILTLIFCTGYITWIKWWLGLILFTILIICCIITYFQTPKCVNLARTRELEYSKIFGQVDDIMTNIQTILTYDKQKDEMSQLDVHQNKYTELTEKTLTCALTIKVVMIPLIISFIIGLIYYCWKAKIGEGKFITLIILSFLVYSATLKITTSTKELLFKWGIIQHSLQAFKRCKDIVKQNDVLEHIQDKMSDGIVFKNVSYSYPNNKIVFKNFNAIVPKNKVTLLVGPIGSGKTTFINLLLKYQKCQQGEIYIDQVPYSDLTLSDIRTTTFYLPQNPRLLNRTVYENIVYGITGIDIDMVNTVVHNLELDDFVQNLPQGLDTNVGVGGSKLSGGQKQIVWLIKLFLMNPNYILLDEPTSALDADTKKIVIDLVVKAMANRTVLIITHDEFLEKYAENVITL
jgi:ABC-type multidrug transport system fused ATPase/permease subunit